MCDGSPSSLEHQYFLAQFAALVYHPRRLYIARRISERQEQESRKGKGMSEKSLSSASFS